MRTLNGKTAFVTGGASGIGLAMCEAFFTRGMQVVVADIREDHLEAARSVLRVGANRVHFVQVDVTNREAMADAAEQAERVFGKIHVLCNNAGVGDGVPIDRAAFEDWDWVLGVNLGGVVNGLVTFIPRLKAHGEGGHIVNTASIHSFIALPAWGGIYSASKFAVRGLSESLRLALAPFDIGVSVLCPGLTKTNIGDSYGLRPARFAPPTRSAEPLHPSAQVVPPAPGSGMDPAEIGERVARGIERNDFYLFTHPEHREEVGELFGEVLEAFPTSGPIDAGRRDFEAARRAATAAAKTLMPRG